MVTYIYKKKCTRSRCLCFFTKNLRVTTDCASIRCSSLAAGERLVALPAADDDDDSFGLCFSASLVVKYCMYHMTEEFFSS